MHRITFDSPYTFGDRVLFKTTDHRGSGEGWVMDIIVGYDQSVYFVIKDDEGDLHYGIYPDEMTAVHHPPSQT